LMPAAWQACPLQRGNKKNNMAITFGRYSDSFKPKEKINLWNESEKLFEEKKYMDSYKAFFNYIRDDKLNNVRFSQTDGKLDFEILQGSKIVRGYLDDKKVTAESDIAKFDKLSVALMRRLVEMNFTLYYTRFALNNDLICLKFDSSLIDGSPKKLYYALKELATRADKQDDLLIDDFSTLKTIEDAHIEKIPGQEKEIKYKYFRKWIEDTFKRISELKEDTFSGAISYLLLNLLYKLDYLISPEGTLMNELEKISYAYFARDNKPHGEKNKVMKEGFQKLLDKPKDAVLEDLYRVKLTFGIANPAPHPAVLDAINSNINNVQWYIDNNKEDIALIIIDYIIGYCLFSYGLAKPTVNLFHLLIFIRNRDYFNELGFTEKYYDSLQNKFDEGAVKDKIDQILKEGIEQYPNLKFNADNLKFDKMINFARSFITEIQTLNYNN
ncbi:MAG: hypothetical protein ACRDFC_07560, partial [Ignavibacteria bacterium]